MRMHTGIRIAFVGSLLAVVFAGFSPTNGCSFTANANACPFCSAPTLTLTEQFAKADAVLLVDWAGGEKPDKEKLGSTKFEILQVLRDPTKKFEKGKAINVDRYRAGKKGDLSLLLGTKGDTIEWGNPLDVTETSFNYIQQAPSPESPAQARLAYFLKFLEFPDQTISNDAYAEFANAPYKDIVPLAKQMPRDKLREWVASKDVPATRLGLYGLMLGLCGDEKDAVTMEKKITEKVDDFRLGVDGVIAGYLLLRGEQGLSLVEKTKFSDKSVPFSETYAALQALRFMWTYGNDRIAPERLRASMRMLLDRPELVDIVIADLARWKDWSVQKKLMEVYGAEEYNVPSIKRAIIRYMFASVKDVPGAGPDKSGATKVADAGTQPKEPKPASTGSVESPAPAAVKPEKSEKPEKLPEHAVLGAKYLDQLREKDPKMVKEVERFLY